MNDISEAIDDIWKGDLLEFAERGAAFISRVKSINDHRTISSEAGYAGVIIGGLRACKETGKPMEALGGWPAFGMMRHCGEWLLGAHFA